MSIKLPAADKVFWKAVSIAAFSNAFSDERRQQDDQIIGPFDGSEPNRVRALKEILTAKTQQLDANGLANFQKFSGEDREIMRIGFLFEVFHRYCLDFDQLIERQSQAGSSSCDVPFAQEALVHLARRGFTHQDAVRFFGIFYQLRRAYFFIYHGLIGQSPCMKHLRAHLWNNVFTSDIRWYDRYLWSRMEDFSTLLLGETGTGKGAAAAAIGRSGFIPFNADQNRFAESFTANFISLNLSQFPETLIESELFGHKKGAFTGAIENHQGAFARCSPHGAIFLDEIGDVSTPVQIKLLQVLQERTFSPVGSHAALRFRGRVIAATNQPLDRLRREKVFRDDFFYRLCSDSIVLPPLRQRLSEMPGELGLLLRHIVERMTGDSESELVDTVRDRLLTSVGRDYHWPGNVRELEQAVRQILLTQRYQRDDAGVVRDSRGELLAAIDGGDQDAEWILSKYCQLLYQRHGTYREVSQITKLDARTVKKYLNVGSPRRTDERLDR
jgi:DNA-binding NtrC family response regulator